MKKKNARKKANLEKQNQRKQGTRDADEKFYLEIYTDFKSDAKWRCAECQKRLPDFDIKESKASFEIRKFCHHILPKRISALHRHNPKNILPLCWDCHQKIEAPVSYEKMAVYKYCETIKAELSESD